MLFRSKLRWEQGTAWPMDVSPAVAANGLIYFSLVWLHVGACDADGKLQWQAKINSNLSASPNVDANGVLYAFDGWSLFALQPTTNAAPLAKSSWPMWRANPQHTGSVQR